MLLSSAFVNAQSLKEALYSGTLKNEPGTVIRKGDDLTAQMDTSTRKAPAKDTLAIITVASPADSAQSKPQAFAMASTAASTTAASQPSAPVQSAPSASSEAVSTSDTTVAVAAEPVAKAKSNNTILKEYVNTLSETLKAEVLSSKKIKKGDYYVMVSYAIGTDGQVTVTDVYVDPQNEFLQQQIKDRLALEMPKLNPVLNDAGQPRKVNKKYNFTLTKD